MHLDIDDVTNMEVSVIDIADGCVHGMHIHFSFPSDSHTRRGIVCSISPPKRS
jgi:hypothetical protein